MPEKMSLHLAFYLIAVPFIAREAAYGFVPPAEFCLPTAGLKELSGCIAMTNKQDSCREKGTDEEKVDCYCTQDMLSAFIE
jgi:hypothetical protein